MIARKENDMGAYIDRDELLELYANTDELDISNYDVKVTVIRQNILDMPTIGIVRCKDCKCGTEVITTDKIICKLDRQVWKKTDFCSYGERRTEQSQINTIENTNENE